MWIFYSCGAKFRSLLPRVSNLCSGMPVSIYGIDQFRSCRKSRTPTCEIFIEILEVQKLNTNPFSFLLLESLSACKVCKVFSHFG